MLCMLGIALASLAVFLFVRRYGLRAVRVFFSEEQIASARFLQDPRRLTLLAVVLFLIPGTPKDVMTYCVGLTSMKLSTWMFIATLAAAIPLHHHVYDRRQRVGHAELYVCHRRVCGHGVYQPDRAVCVPPPEPPAREPAGRAARQMSGILAALPCKI